MIELATETVTMLMPRTSAVHGKASACGKTGHLVRDLDELATKTITMRMPGTSAVHGKASACGKMGRLVNTGRNLGNTGRNLGSQAPQWGKGLILGIPGHVITTSWEPWEATP